MPRLTFSSRLARSLVSESYVCPSCRSKDARTPGVQSAKHFSTRSKQPAQQRSSVGRTNHDRIPCVSHEQPHQRHRAHYASLASSTAINPPSTVPAKYANLHRALVSLQEVAGSYVDISRLQLAIRGLESSTPTVRVALLGLGPGGAHAARKLARVILSDVLGDGEASWERQILESGTEGRSLLLRYGDSGDVVQDSPLIQTIHVPSLFLQKGNVEILVTTLNASNIGQLTTEGLQDALLVPTLTTPTSAGGRVGFVRYPVHKALVVAEGITGAVQFGRLPENAMDNTLTRAALSLPLRNSTGLQTAEESTTSEAVDIDLATHALELFRADRANGAKFGDEWLVSRITAVSTWIAGPKYTEGQIRPALQDLLDSVLTTTSTKINAVESEYHALSDRSTVQSAKRKDISRAISSWSAGAHRDLQYNLSAALQSKSWRRTAWFRLLWRIDDVSFSAGDILRLAWLTEAEQSLAFLSGRIQEAGLATAAELKEASSLMQIWAKNEEDRGPGIHRKSVNDTGELWQQPLLIESVKRDSGIDVAFDPPWPQTIHLSRQQMLHTLIPAFHRKAQILLVSTLSTVGATTALGAWLFIATQGIALYEAGAIASLGLVWSLRRLQKIWMKERETLAETFREDGRKVLAEVEGRMRKIVHEGGRSNVRPEDEKSFKDARAALARCRQTLTRLLDIK
nr:hypothetical protein CFP56_29985 [Quercus suber]